MTQSTLNTQSRNRCEESRSRFQIITRAPLLSLIKYSLWFGKTPDGYVFVGDAADFRVRGKRTRTHEVLGYIFPEM